MKLEELMIGDWVAIDEPDRYHGYNGKVVAIGGENRYVTLFVPVTNHDVFEEDIRPIPISEDILLKNGFEEIKVEDIYSVYRDKDCDITPDVDDDCKLCWMLYCGKNDHDANICLHFVHELQNTLRLCGIEKIIEL